METIPSSIWLAAHTIYYNNPINTNSGDGLAVAVGDVVKAVTFSKNPASVIEESNAAEHQAVSHSHTPSSSLRTRSRLHHQKPATSKKERGGGAVGAGESSSSSAGNGRESQIYKSKFEIKPRFTINTKCQLQRENCHLESLLWTST
jgi:hypothetical protein